MPPEAPVTTAASARPAPGSKPAQIIEAAVAVFLEQGYGAASMDAIARAANVSKATLYAHFAGKEQLFAALITDWCHKHKVLYLLGQADLERMPVRDALVLVADAFVRLTLQPETVAMQRLVVAEAGRFPELGRIYYEAGPAVILDRLAGFLAGAARRGQLRPLDEPVLAAGQFLQMTKGHLQLRLLLAMPVGDLETCIPRHVAIAVDTFLRAYGAV